MLSQSIRSLLIGLLTSLCIYPILASGALDLAGRVQFNEVCPRYEDLRGARVVLNGGGRYSAYVNKEGRFTIPSVDNGTYVLSVIAHGYLFDHYRIDVSETKALPSVHAYIPGTPLSSNVAAPLAYPILLTPRAKNAYFVEREGFNLVAMLQSPMMLLMIGTGALLFLTPYLMSRMDQDSLEELKGKQSKMLAAQSSITNMDISGGLSNLLGNDAENKAKPASQALSSSPAKSKAKSRKR